MQRKFRHIHDNHRKRRRLLDRRIRYSHIQGWHHNARHCNCCRSWQLYASSFTCTAPVPTDAGSYDAQVANGCGTVTSSAATLTVNQKSTNPASASAAPLTMCNGQSATLTLNGGGGGPGEPIQWCASACG